MLMRSKLFVPASRPELFAKAMASQADVISFDLEDAVEPASKERARSARRVPGRYRELARVQKGHRGARQRSGHAAFRG